MMAKPDREQPDSEGAEGVFGNLPSSRPGSRSPRRRTSDGEQAEERPVRSARKARKPAPPPPPPKPPPSRPLPPSGAERKPAAPDAPGSAQGAKGVEDLAWAGVAVAAQAATVGVRLANRALEAARKSIDRP